MTWIPCLEELRSNPDPTCPICDGALRRLDTDPCCMMRCDKCAMSFTSPEVDDERAFAAELEADAHQGRCRVCGCAEQDAGFEGWMFDPLGGWLCSRCA